MRYVIPRRYTLLTFSLYINKDFIFYNTWGDNSYEYTPVS